MKKEKKITKKKDYEKLIHSIGYILEQGRKQAYQTVNTILVKTYWEIGKTIADYEEANNERAEYGTKLFETIVQDLRSRYGKGFSRSNVIYMRLFYVKYQKSQTLSDQLSWSHYIEFLKRENDLERTFYERQCILEKWSVRELQRQINSALFHQIALSKDKHGVLELSKKRHIIQADQDIVKDPYILEFLKIPEHSIYTEKELEQKIIDNLQFFLLELGKGFTFVGRQYRISLGNKHFFTDLVFYNRMLRCFVLVDLKIGEVTHNDIGQMNLYLNYFKEEENSKGDNDPIGIILGSEKDHLMVKYALGGLSNKLFVSKYKLYLPNIAELEERLRKMLKD